ncbi:diaminopimelate decarboxylase [Mycobacterium tuberculosis]|nr:diaminopimelate decarboxylase [Mycobacterium tuberculosis]OHO21182.1 diaminopimelate decarboxylase [Mycobacterium tuberculosis]
MERISAWLNGLDRETYELVFAAIEVLEEEGPALGCPLVDTVRGSRHKNMKELRPGSQGRSEVRILFAFDPARQAIMNRPGMSGDSSSWKGWGHVRWFIEEVPAGAA